MSPLLPNIENKTIMVVEFDETKHMNYAKSIMDLDEELNDINSKFNPAKFIDQEPLGKISYRKYIKLLLDNNWRLFVIIFNNECIGYIHTTPGKYENSVYLGSFIISKKYTGKGYGAVALKQWQKLIKNEYDIIILNVAIENKMAMSLYTKSGFKPSHVMMYKKI